MSVRLEVFHTIPENSRAQLASIVASDASLSGPNDQPYYCIFPGFCDVHVHFREPGFSYKGTVRTESKAAAHGGYTAVCTMPNLDPVPDCPDHLKVEMEIIERDALIHVYPYGAITLGEKGEVTSEMEALAPSVIAFSDDGFGVQSEMKMLEAMVRSKLSGKIIAAHCEDNTLSGNGVVHEGPFSRENGLPGIPSSSEWKQVERDLFLAEETRCPYHICHVSTKESVELIREAKAKGLDVTCETAPHYLLLDDTMLKDDGAFKMKPPIRSPEDRDALLKGVLDGTIDMIATDHAPHSSEEKAKGLAGSAFGITGLEFAFPLLYTELVRPGVLSLDALLNLMVYNPRKRFSIPLSEDDYSLWRMDRSFVLQEDLFLSAGRSTPFLGRTVFADCLLTVCGGEAVYHPRYK
ncbi:MAG: dihydroorotase [Clostridia bacterium]|nr:dihydroorotase [Clostridia bacterium]